MFLNFFPCVYMLKDSLLLRSQRCDLAKILTHQSFYACLVTCKNKSNLNALKWPHNISHTRYMGIFPSNSTVRGRIWPNFELVCDVMVVFVTYRSFFTTKSENIQSKMKALECLHHYTSFFFRRSGAANSLVSCGIWPKFELI